MAARWRWRRGKHATLAHAVRPFGALRHGIVADGSGVLCVPAEHALQVVERTAKYARDDAEAAIELGRGLNFREAMAKFTHLR